MSRIHPSKGFATCVRLLLGRLQARPFLIGLALADKIGFGFGRLILSPPCLQLS